MATGNRVEGPANPDPLLAFASDEGLESSGAIGSSNGIDDGLWEYFDLPKIRASAPVVLRQVVDQAPSDPRGRATNSPQRPSQTVAAARTDEPIAPPLVPPQQPAAAGPSSSLQVLLFALGDRAATMLLRLRGRAASVRVMLLGLRGRAANVRVMLLGLRGRAANVRVMLLGLRGRTANVRVMLLGLAGRMASIRERLYQIAAAAKPDQSTVRSSSQEPGTTMPAPWMRVIFRWPQTGWLVGVSVLVAAIATVGLTRAFRGSGPATVDSRTATMAIDWPRPASRPVVEPRAASDVIQPLAVPAVVETAVPAAPQPVVAPVALAVRREAVAPPPVVREQVPTPIPPPTEPTNAPRLASTVASNSKPLPPAVPTGAPASSAPRPRPSEPKPIRAAAPAQPLATASLSRGDQRSAPEPKDTFVGAIAIDSHPAGAQVFLDGKAVGQTPLAAADLRAGSHVVRLDMDGYERWSAAVQVVTYKKANVTAQLQPVASRP